MAVQIKDHARGQRASSLRWVKLGDCVPSPKGQREFRPAWANTIAANLDIEKIGFPVVSKRGDRYHIIDGQHRIEALKIFGFSNDDTIQVECYEELTDKQEAEQFLGRNTVKRVDALSQFRAAVHAQRPDECQIDQIVRFLGLRIGRRTRGAGSETISAISALQVAYRRLGADGLAKALRIVRDAFGSAGLESLVIEAVGLCVQRYGDLLDEDVAVTAFEGTIGGLSGVLNQAEKTHLATGQARAHCVAATLVEVYNRARSNKAKRLAPWWRESAETDVKPRGLRERGAG